MKSNTLIRFSWYEILKVNRYKCEDAYSTLSKVLEGRYSIPKSSTLDCWLFNPIEFLVSVATIQQKCVYLHIATRRNWMDYKEKGTISVPLYVVEDMYNIDTLRTNPLLTINDDSIDLKY